MKTYRNPPEIKIGQVLLLFDWENIWYSLFTKFGVGSMDVECRVKTLMDWTKKIGKLLGGHGFVFAPEHFSDPHRKIFVDQNFRIMVCPKKHLRRARFNIKTRQMEMNVDTVDEAIMNFARLMIRHPDFKFFCLVAGDGDYAPLLAEMGRHNIKRALVAPTQESLSSELKRLVDAHPVTGEPMLFMLDEI